MNENQLIKTWNDQRSALIKSQLPQSIVLAVILALGATGHLTNKSDLTLRLFALAIGVAGGVSSLRVIFATLRDGVSLVKSLEEIKGLSPMGKAIRKSSPSLILSRYLFTVFTLLNFTLLGFYLFKR